MQLKHACGQQGFLGIYLDRAFDLVVAITEGRPPRKNSLFPLSGAFP
jgi:hypothetical protein